MADCWKDAAKGWTKCGLLSNLFISVFVEALWKHSCINPWVSCTLLLDRSACVIGCWCPGAHDFATWDLLLQHIERPCPTASQCWKLRRMLTKVEIAGSLYVVSFAQSSPKTRQKARLDCRMFGGVCNCEIGHVSPKPSTPQKLSQHYLNGVCSH